MTDRDDYADWLVRLALELSGRVREYPADANAAWLRAMVADTPDPPSAYRDLAIMLAALVPYDSRPSELLAWWHREERVRTAERILGRELALPVIAERYGAVA